MLTSGSLCVSKYQAIILRHTPGNHDAGSTANGQGPGLVGEGETRAPTACR